MANLKENNENKKETVKRKNSKNNTKGKDNESVVKEKKVSKSKNVKTVVNEKKVKSEKKTKVNSNKDITLNENITSVNNVEKTKKKNILGIILTIGIIVLVILAFVVSIIETNERSKYFNEISYSEFSELLNDDEVNIIYWASPSCSYCTQFKPTVLDVSYDHKLMFNYLNTSNLTKDETAKMYTHFMSYDEIYNSNRLGTPSLILVQGGKIINISEGLMPEDELITYLKGNNLIK